jgi:Phosphotransferase enzyme family
VIDYLDSLVATHWQEWTESRDPFPSLYWTLLANGDTFYFDNVVLLGTPVGDTKPIFVAKVCRLPAFDLTLNTEYKNIKTLWGIINGKISGVLPHPYILAKHGNDHILLTSFLDGESLLSILHQKPNAENEFYVKLARSAAETLRFFHDMSSTPTAPLNEPGIRIEEKIRLFQQLFYLNPDETAYLDQLTKVFRENAVRSKQYVLLHGDFWQGNIIKQTDTGKLAVIDWQFSMWSPDASIDVYMYLLAGALASVPYNTEEKRAADTAHLLVEWQFDLIPNYLQAYGEVNGYGLLPVRDGMLLCCIEMATRTSFFFNTQYPNDWLWAKLFSGLYRLFPSE